MVYCKYIFVFHTFNYDNARIISINNNKRKLQFLETAHIIMNALQVTMKQIPKIIIIK